MTDDTSPSPRIALVTGGTRGIGFEIVTQLAQRGMTVLLGARDRARGEEAASRIDAGSGAVEVVEIDVSEDASVTAAAENVTTRFGRLDVLVNNAGLSGGYEHQQPTALDVATMLPVWQVNFFGVVRTTNALLPLLRRSDAAVIVNVSSVVGSLLAQSDPASELSAMPASGLYVPTKSALNSLTQQYAREVREEGILVNAVNPGFCDTDFNNHRGTVPPADGARVAVTYATIAPDGPTGGFFSAEGPERW